MPDPSALVAKMRDLTVRVISQESRALKDAADYIEASEKREAALKKLCDDAPGWTSGIFGMTKAVSVDEIRAIYPEWGKAEA